MDDDSGYPYDETETTIFSFSGYYTVDFVVK